MLTVIREMAEESERKEHRSLRPNDLLRVRARARRGCPRAHARDARVLQQRRRRGRRRRRSRRDRARHGLRRDWGGDPGSAGSRRRPSASMRFTWSCPSSATARSSSSKGRTWTRTRSRRELERIGDSLLVVGDSTALKVHVHTDDPGRRSHSARRSGVVEGVEIANMHVQTAQRRGTTPRGWCADRARNARDGPRRRVSRAREPSAVREPGRHARHRGRPVDEPVRGRHPRGDRGRADGRRARPSEQLERDPDRRAGSGR